ncbi:MAG TPA: penicillin-binding protein 1C, partial [Candidatus Bacteroides pullicola]|nr:penicillin-binding protein 1C [Candidatus Bacteroides pullicola]
MRRRLHIILLGITRLSPRRKAGFICILLLLLAYAFCLPRQLFQVPYSTVVTDCHGELLGARIAPDGQWRFPPCDTVPRKFVRCLLAFEDRHFYYHPGVNPLSMARAAWQNIQQGRIVSGGSTLTMQTIRISRNRPRTFAEKVVEMILATRLELRCSKDEILALYASHAPFGGNVVGLDAAAWRYFAHPASELSWAEAATLAVLPNAPSAIHPGKGREALLRKRNRVLRLLLEQGEISTSDYALALDEPLPDAPLPLPRIAPHLVDRLASEHPGQTLVSTIDKSLQLRLEALAERHSQEFARSDIRNLAILVIDLRENQVAAYCGNTGFGQSAEGSQVDIIRAPRSTGSILKPFLYYAALEEGLILPHTLLPDVTVNINGFAPQNFSRQFEGAVPASEALARSLNIPAVHLLQQYG